MDDQNRTQSHFEFTFAGENELNVETLIAGLQSLNTLVMATKETCLENTECNLKVVANRQGSFIIDLMIAAQTAYTIITPANINYAANCASLIVDFFEIKRHIGNCMPRKTFCDKKKMSVENADGKVRSFSKEAEGYFKNATIENCIIQIINDADKNPNVSGIRVETEDKQLSTIDRAEFSAMNEPVIENMEHPVKEVKSTDTFYIKQPVCIGDSKWEFQKDHHFYAKISDSKWMQEYKEGKHPIVPGVQLKVEMTSYLHIGDDGLPIEGKTAFEITKVLDTIYPHKFPQMKLY